MQQRHNLPGHTRCSLHLVQPHIVVLLTSLCLRRLISTHDNHTRGADHQNAAGHVALLNTPCTSCCSRSCCRWVHCIPEYGTPCTSCCLLPQIVAERDRLAAEAQEALVAFSAGLQAQVGTGAGAPALLLHLAPGGLAAIGQVHAHGGHEGDPPSFSFAFLECEMYRMQAELEPKC